MIINYTPLVLVIRKIMVLFRQEKNNKNEEDKSAILG